MTNLDLEQLEKAYNHALALEKAGELDRSAEAWRKVLAIDPLDHGGAAVRLASMGRGEAPDKAPVAYVATLFDQTAEVFDEVLVGQLGYSVPEELRRMLDRLAPGQTVRVLDAGCGTGLTGVALRNIAGHLTGVDISENMVAMAWDREVYDDLFVCEAVQFMEEEDGEPWDLVTATDVLPYLGDLGPFFSAAAAIIRPGGHLAFSTETLAPDSFGTRDWLVGPNQRFAHRETYVASRLRASGFETVEVEPIVVRRENGAPVHGHLFLAQRR